MSVRELTEIEIEVIAGDWVPNYCRVVHDDVRSLIHTLRERNALVTALKREEERLIDEVARLAGKAACLESKCRVHGIDEDD